MFKEFWEGLAPSARRGLLAGLVAIGALTLALAWWTLRVDYAVLFGNLSPRDAAAMAEELDRLKMPYRLGADGASILVDRTQVPATRLKLMSKDIPLHGAVGFELFNNADFGMTEFAQKINFQRALQGELTRTILSLQEIESARVHVAFPEEGLFKRDQQKAKASVTLAMKPGQVLHADQVAGIQRLVAASVSGIAAGDVTIVNEHGVALTRASLEGDADAGAASDLKREVEQALARKAAAILDKALGAGRAAVSVDATLDMSQVRVTQEDVTHPAPAQGDAPAGVIVRQRESVKDEATGGAAQREQAPGANTQRETEYQVGRRVEQVVSQPGSIRRLQVVAVVQGGLTPAQVDQMRALLSTAVGASSERGDQVLVQVAEAAATEPAASGVALEPAPAKTADERGMPAREVDRVVVDVLVGALALALAVGVFCAVVLLRRRVSRASKAGRTEPMTEEQRQVALARMREWLAADDAALDAAGARDAR